MDELSIGIPKTFSQIMVPYFPYFFYVYGFYIGMIFPVFLFLLRRAVYDWQDWRAASSGFYKHCPGAAPLRNPPTKELQDLALEFQNYVIKLKGIAERYVPVILAVSLGLLYEQLTPSYRSVTKTAVEAGKVGLWLLLVPTLLICITIVALGYQNAVRRTESGLRVIIDAAARLPEGGVVLDKILGTRAELLWKQSPAEFILTVVKSGSISIPLLVAATAYVLQTVHGANTWFEVFVPRAVVHFFEDLYK